MAATFEHASRYRTLLSAIVSDPALGPAVLSHPATLFSLLCEYLPDAPDETGPLLAAAQVDIPGMLRAHVAEGMSCEKAIQLAAARLAARTRFHEQACLWAVYEFALALGLVAAGPELNAAAGAELLPVRGAGQRGSSGRRSGHLPGQRNWLAVITGAVVAVAGATGFALLSQRHVAGLDHPHPGYSHRTPAARTTSVGPSTAGARSASASADARAHPTARRAARSRPSTSHRPSPASPASPAPADPAVIARNYIAEVNEHDWPAVWQLGGGNVLLAYQPDPAPLTYPEMVANFRHTVSVTITSLTAVGDRVTMHVSALDSAGVTQYYELKLVIGAGRVVSGSQYFLGP